MLHRHSHAVTQPHYCTACKIRKGQWGLGRYLPLGFWTPRSTFAKLVFDLSTLSMRKVDKGGNRGEKENEDGYRGHKCCLVITWLPDCIADCLFQFVSLQGSVRQRSLTLEREKKRGREWKTQDQDRLTRCLYMCPVQTGIKDRRHAETQPVILVCTWFSEYLSSSPQ